MKFIIITSQRTGSTFLRRSLNTHPEVTCWGELLIGGNIPIPPILEDRRLAAKVYRYIRARAWNPVRILQNFIDRQESNVVGCKIMYNHLVGSKSKQFLQEHTEIRIIHLRRDNLLKQYISKKLLGVKRRKKWEPHSNINLPVVSTYIHPEAAIKAMRRNQRLFKKFEVSFSKHPKIEIIYENMIRDGSMSAPAANEVCRLLEIECRQMSCDSVKVNPNRLELVIKNYEEVARALKNTEFERFLA